MKWSTSFLTPVFASSSRTFAATEQPAFSIHRRCDLENRPCWATTFASCSTHCRLNALCCADTTGGGRAACVVAALWPERCHRLVTCGGYNIQNIAESVHPAPPEIEYANWYQYYFNTERGRAGLTNDRCGIARLLWTLWSPTWTFDDTTFERSAEVFDNPDFVDVVIHSYRHRYGYVKGDLAVVDVELALAVQPHIAVPTINLASQASAWPVKDSRAEHAHFSGAYEQRLLPGIGHNVPQEAPVDFAAAVLDLAKNT